jgi:hypothetical protein
LILVVFDRRQQTNHFASSQRMSYDITGPVQTQKQRSKCLGSMTLLTAPLSTAGDDVFSATSSKKWKSLRCEQKLFFTSKPNIQQVISQLSSPKAFVIVEKLR